MIEEYIDLNREALDMQRLRKLARWLYRTQLSDPRASRLTIFKALLYARCAYLARIGALFTGLDNRLMQRGGVL